MEARIAAVCCAVVCMATICTSNMPVLQCDCLRVSNTIVSVDKLWSYTMQRAGLCSIKAIVFETVKGKILCSDPRSPWAHRAKNYLDMKPTNDVTPKPQTRTKASTVLPKRKRIWLQWRQNRWKKPGLREKQRINHLNPLPPKVSKSTIKPVQKSA